MFPVSQCGGQDQVFATEGQEVSYTQLRRSVRLLQAEGEVGAPSEMDNKFGENDEPLNLRVP